jgi:branched-chain amino acid transport system permease protein
VAELTQHVVDALSVGSLYALLALGIALIFGIMRLINFAHGELIMVGGYALTFLVARTVWPVWVLVTIGIVVATALLMDRVAFRPFRGAEPSTLLVTSFAVSFFLQNLAIVTMGSLPRSVALPAVLERSVSVGSVQVQNLNILTVVATAVLLGALAVFLRETSLGIQMRAAAEDFEMARALGVRANAVVALAFGLSGLFAGIACLVLVAKGGTLYPSIGLIPVVYAFTATIIGGMGSLLGAVLGGYILGALTVALQATLPLAARPYRDSLVFAVVIAILVLRPQGLIVARSVSTRV